jgi:uncharacterized membrane protein
VNFSFSLPPGWLAFSLMGTDCMGAAVVIDDFLLGRYARDPLAYSISLIFSQRIFTPCSSGSRVRVISTLIPSLLSWQALSRFSCWVTYLNALNIEEEPPECHPWSSSNPVLVLIGAYLFLGESLSSGQILGGMLLVSSALMIS